MESSSGTERPSRLFRIAIGAIFAAACAAVTVRLAVIGGAVAWSEVEDMLDLAGVVPMGATLARLGWHFVRMRDERRYWEAAILIPLASLPGVCLFNLILNGRNVPYLRLGQPMILLANPARRRGDRSSFSRARPSTCAARAGRRDKAGGLPPRASGSGRVESARTLSRSHSWARSPGTGQRLAQQAP